MIWFIDEKNWHSELKVVDRAFFIQSLWYAFPLSHPIKKKLFNDAQWRLFHFYTRISHSFDYSNRYYPSFPPHLSSPCTALIATARKIQATSYDVSDFGFNWNRTHFAFLKTQIHKSAHKLNMEFICGLAIDLLTLAVIGLSGGSSDNPCGTGTAAANEHNAMAIKIKYFHDIICIFVYIFFLLWLDQIWNAHDKTKKNSKFMIINLELCGK